MRINPSGVVIAATVFLSACHGPAEGPEPGAGARGRYLGIGVYSAGQLWSRMKVTAPRDPAAATIDDDEHVIVVVDSRTGEVRQCGDYSGVCVGANPWNTPLAMPAGAPVNLTAHAAELAAVRAAEVAAEERKVLEAKSNH